MNEEGSIPGPAGRMVLFLDIDGVCHPFDAASPGAFFKHSCMAALKAVVDSTGAALVLSSSWQSTVDGRAAVDAALKAEGIPSCAGQTLLPGKSTRGSERGRALEIREWVARHPQMCASGWLALDDLDLRTLLDGRAVRTDAMVGMTQADARRAIHLLQPAAPAMISATASDVSITH